ncbi:MULTISPECIES: RNA polymerase sigma factor [unclassified Novosphingobium]|uniref:RNA polymerase sigma factor n=1 Tax=unclassified Novosphingobium TaxID=2644732 RepID=UPI00146AA30B|nr:MULTISPECIES: RNA polymerase sigma factor [unclassified Novosphingobium]NMN06800.1 RNA polymerase sigma-70 factor (ECF subfamily) [Novosphingobium sp. SG919]NMN88749.1 RNA polymerase sigma-70 factor (ECF subfamily) [Novosphingobium sp. SG916]
MTKKSCDRHEANSKDEGAIAGVGSSDFAADLLASLEQNYTTLLIKLSAYLRSPDAAADALHDTYVKLRSQHPITDLRQPRAYLYRMAINLALNSRRKDIRMVPKVMSEFEGFPDGAPDPERSALAIREMEQMFAALHALSPKSRAIFLARWRDEKTNEEIATTLGIHKRSVQKDLARTELHLRAMLGRLKNG